MGPRATGLAFGFLCCVLALPAPCTAQIPRSKFRIVFDEAQPPSDTRRPTPEVDVYIVGLWSETPKHLTSDHRSHSPSWSPDGRRIAFLQDDRPLGAPCPPPSASLTRFACHDPAETLWLMDARGKNLVRVATDLDSSVQETAWLPDGTTLALRSSNPQDRALIVAHGRQFEPPVDGCGEGAAAALPAPNATRELYCPPVDNKQAAVVDQTEPAKPENFRTRVTVVTAKELEPALEFWTSIPFPPDPTAKLQFLSMSGKEVPIPVSAYDASWSPDGGRIAYSRFPEGQNAVLYVADWAGGQLRNERALTDPSLDAHGPAWSADGSRLAFSGAWIGGQQVFVVNPDGSGLTRVGQDVGKVVLGSDQPLTCSHPSWSPDGRWIVAECQDQDLASLSTSLCRNPYALYSSLYRFDVRKPEKIPHLIVDCRYQGGRYSYQRDCGAHNPSFAPVPPKATSRK